MGDMALSDLEAELLVRWMWKFEGLQWALATAGGSSHQRYSGRYTLIERVTQPAAFDEVRAELVLGIAMVNQNDPGFKDWPLGLDTPPGQNAISMSGVFGRIAMVTSLRQFIDAIDPAFGRFSFGAAPVDRDARIFEVARTFITANAAIAVTRETGLRLMTAHERMGELWRAATPIPVISRPRIELPPV
jgi:hypothetical protein